ncbi:MAG: hypothetical protein AB4352_04950 [Hormoscilla sp.]
MTILMIADRTCSVKGRSPVSGAQDMTMNIWQRCATGSTSSAPGVHRREG